MKKWYLLVILFVIPSTVAFSSDYKVCDKSKDVEKRIIACTKILERGTRETARNRSIAFTFRSNAHLDKSDIHKAEADLASAVAVDPNNPNLASLRERIAFTKTPRAPPVGLSIGPAPARSSGMSYSLARPYLGATNENSYAAGSTVPAKDGSPLSEGIIANLTSDDALLNLQKLTLAEAKQLADSSPDKLENKNALFNAHSNLGHTYYKRGELPEALENMRKAVGIAELFVQSDPKSRSWQRALGMMHGHVASTLARQTGTSEDAKNDLQKDREIIARLALESPGDGSLAKDLSWFDGLDERLKQKQ